MKSTLETSERKCAPSETTGSQPELGGKELAHWVRPHWVRCGSIPNEHAVRAGRGKVDHLKHQGSSLETGELRSERRDANLGKLPCPATSRTKSRVLVVVGARESRAHGEGGQ
jgi:hypothetical protein